LSGGGPGGKLFGLKRREIERREETSKLFFSFDVSTGFGKVKVNFLSWTGPERKERGTNIVHICIRYYRV
jgi:hypothetical protein